MSQESISVSISEITLAGLPGPQGASAYEVAVANGFEGDESAWLASIEGDQGLSAYDVAVANGFEGDESAWLESLDGADGANGVSFQPDATGLLSTRSTYDAQASGFVFLATDTGDLYFRETSTAGVWSLPVPFSMALLAPSGNPYLQAHLDRLTAGAFDISRFDRKLHDDVFDAAGDAMDDCHMLLLDRGAFEVVRPSSTVTISIANPAVVTWTAHGLYAGDPVVFQTSGALPTGLVAGQTYYVSRTSNSANSFIVTDTPFGTNVVTSGSQSGTHTAERTRTDITKWASADPNGNDATPIPLLYSTFKDTGFPLRPFFDSDGNIRSKSAGSNTAGFYRSGNPFANATPRMMVFAIFKQDAADVVFASKAAMDADLSYPAGTLAEITDKTQINAGIWAKSSAPTLGSWVKTSPQMIGGPASDQRFETGIRGDLIPSGAWIDADSQLTAFATKTSNATFAMPNSLGDPIVGDGTHILAISYDGGNVEVWLDGIRVVRSAALAFTEFNAFAELFIARRGLSTIRAMGFWRGFDSDRFRKIHNALSENYLLPEIDDRPVLMGFSSSGQSLAAGTTTVGDTWLTANGWNGVVTGDRRDSPSRKVVPGWLSTNGFLASGGDPVGMFISGSASVQFTMAPGGMSSEGIFFGFADHLVQNNVPYAGWMGAWGVGGQPLAALRKPATARVLETLLGPAPASNYERGIRQILLAKRYADKNGYRFEMGAFLWMHGNADATNANYTTELLSFYDEFNADCKAITGQSNNVIMLLDAVNYSTDGVVNSLAAINQRQLNVIANRGSRPIFSVAPGYPISNFIHWYARGYRWQGEQFAKAWLDIYQRNGNFTGVTPVSAVRDGSSVLLTFNVPVPPLQFDTNDNNVETLLTNRGFEYVGGGRTITSVELVGTTQVRINLSGPSGAGHSVAYVKGNRYGNLCDSDARAAVYRDQDWSTGIWPAPAEADGQLNDLRNWAFPFEIELS